MFRTDEIFRVPIPAALRQRGDTSAYYRFVEATANSPIWLVQALTQEENGLSRWKRIWVYDVESALEVLSHEFWAARNLYVLLPEHLSGLNQISFGLCTSLSECQEPDGSHVCWRIETNDFVVLDSTVGTQLGEETSPVIRWASTGVDRGT